MKKMFTGLCVLAVFISGCDLFSGAQATATRISTPTHAPDEMPSGGISYDEDAGSIVFTYKGDFGIADDERMQRSIAASGAARSIIPPSLTTMSDMYVNTVSLVVIDTAYPTQIADYDEVFDDNAALSARNLTVKAKVSRGSAYHVLMLLGYRKTDASYDRTLLRSGYVYLTTYAPSNRLTVPIIPLIIDVEFLSSSNSSFAYAAPRSVGRLAKSVGIDANLDTMRVYFGSTAHGATDPSDLLRRAGGNGLYALAEAEWMQSNTKQTWDGNGVLTFTTSTPIIVNGIPASIENPTSGPAGVTKPARQVACTNAATPFFDYKLSVNAPTGGAADAGGIAFTLTYDPFGIPMLDNSQSADNDDAADGPWWNWQAMTAWTKESGALPSLQPPSWHIRNGANESLPSTGDPSGATGMENGAIPVRVVATGGISAQGIGIYEDGNPLAIDGTPVLFDQGATHQGALGMALDFMNNPSRAAAAAYGSYTLVFGEDDEEDYDRDIGFGKQSSNTVSAANLHNVTLYFDATKNVSITVASGSRPLFDVTPDNKWFATDRVKWHSTGSPTGYPTLSGGSVDKTSLTQGGGTAELNFTATASGGTYYAVCLDADDASNPLAGQITADATGWNRVKLNAAGPSSVPSATGAWTGSAVTLSNLALWHHYTAYVVLEDGDGNPSHVNGTQKPLVIGPFQPGDMSALDDSDKNIPFGTLFNQRNGKPFIVTVSDDYPQNGGTLIANSAPNSFTNNAMPDRSARYTIDSAITWESYGYNAVDNKVEWTPITSGDLNKLAFRAGKYRITLKLAKKDGLAANAWTAAQGGATVPWAVTGIDPTFAAACVIPAGGSAIQTSTEPPSPDGSIFILHLSFELKSDGSLGGS